MSVIEGAEMSVALGGSLRELKEAAGLSLVSVVSSDGLVIESAHDPDADAEAVATVAASGLLMMDSLGRELNQGPAKDVILEYEENLVILSPLNEDLLLVAVGDGSTNLGRVRLLLRRSLSKVGEAVEQS
jgi:predicted regulator of Ras-like GTPase activity (Roadblock/LC7/MglB family)